MGADDVIYAETTHPATSVPGRPLDPRRPSGDDHGERPRPRPGGASTSTSGHAHGHRAVPHRRRSAAHLDGRRAAPEVSAELSRPAAIDRRGQYVFDDRFTMRLKPSRRRGRARRWRSSRSTATAGTATSAGRPTRARRSCSRRWAPRSTTCSTASWASPPAPSPGRTCLRATAGTRSSTAPSTPPATSGRPPRSRWSSARPADALPGPPPVRRAWDAPERAQRDAEPATIVAASAIRWSLAQGGPSVARGPCSTSSARSARMLAARASTSLAS